jgi:outer membrane protein OmpA-like peptidoglycan-associated protein
MKRLFGSVLTSVGVIVTLATGAMAQNAPASGQQQTPPPASPSSDDTRYATPTFLGDTGLWYVPTGENLPAKRWSFSGYFSNIDREAGFTDISHYIGTFGYGINDRVELFGSVRFVTRIDRDFRPLFDPTNGAGGVVNDYPFANRGWSGNAFGDILVGGKFNILSEYTQAPVALAVRGALKLPSGDDGKGASTGKADFFADVIVSKEISQVFELSGYGGFIVRGQPDDIEISNGFRWGIGAGFPTRIPLKITAELHGERYFDDVVSGVLPLATDGSGNVLFATPNKNPADFTLAATWFSPKGFFIGAGATVNVNQKARSSFGSQFDDEGGDNMGMQFRIGYHPGVRVYAPPPPPKPEPPPVAPVNRPPTVKARCEPCIVEVGKSATVTADANDPDGDPLKYKWSTPTGTLANNADRQTLWTAPMQEGSVPVTVTVDDGKSGTATDTVTIQVIKPPVKEYKFEDVHFDFDRYSLRPEAARILDEAIRAMQENATLRIEIEGHTCSIGTAEYNLALGERRATAVRDYLTSRGIGADRLRTVTYGEERPKHDNAREETRRLNRRAELVVRLQQ